MKKQGKSPSVLSHSVYWEEKAHMLIKSPFVKSSSVISPAAISAWGHYDQPEHLNSLISPFSHSNDLTPNLTFFLILPYINLQLLNHSCRFTSLHLLIICHSFLPQCSLHSYTDHSCLNSSFFWASFIMCLSPSLSPPITPSVFSSTEPRLVSIHLHLWQWSRILFSE